MGLRVIPINVLVPEATTDVRGTRQNASRTQATGAREPAGTRTARLGALASEATRAVNLSARAEDGLAEIDARLNAIRDAIVEAGSRALLGDTDLATLQRRIGRNMLRINLIAQTTRFFGVGVFDGSIQDEQFDFGQDTVRITIGNLAAEELGRGVPNQTGITNLSQINIARFPPGVRLPRGLTDAFLVAEAAINDTARAREDLEVFQRDVFASAFRALRAERRENGLSETGLRAFDFTRVPPRAALSEIFRQTNLIALQTALDRPGALLNMVM